MSYPVNEHQKYHAHIYFDSDTVELARHIWHQVQNDLNMAVGRFHERPVGPHPCWSFQIAFTSAQFDTLILWLDNHRQGLTILVHSETGDFITDHTVNARWLGEPARLKLSF